MLEEVHSLPPIDIEKYTLEDDLAYQQKKDQIKNSKTNQANMWKNLEKALGAQADQEEREYLHRNSNDSASNVDNGRYFFKEFSRARLSSDFEPAQIATKEESKDAEPFAKINVI